VNEAVSAEERANLAAMTKRFFKRARRTFILGIVMVVFYYAVVPRFKDYSPKVHAVYVENEIYYTINLWLGLMLIVMSILMMLHAKMIDAVLKKHL
jgi:hypothetical protein